MATRSNIGALQNDGTIKVIYCHWDGYPEGAGATLTEHYTDPAKVEALLNLGDISSLRATIEETEAESYAKRGVEGVQTQTYQDENEWLELSKNSDVEYLYLFKRDSFSGEYCWSFFSLYERWHTLPTKVMA
jgi:hypothetical protein